jgi:glycerol-3-phosphate dehydrogenase (NAD(P)+)
MSIAVVGGGSWGTALAAHLVRCGREVKLWLLEADVAAAINERHENPAYLPGVALPEALTATTRMEEAVGGATLVFVVVPSEFCRGVYRQLAPLVPAGALVVSATKGIELDTLARMSEVAAQELPGRRLVVISGPSFAAEVAQEKPTVLVAASADIRAAEEVQRVLSSRTLRVYSSQDVVGVELGGALKNVIAIAAGIVDGLGLGLNATAALITRGLAEITRLAVAEGGRAETLAGLAGLGDLVLTCTGDLSRNRRVGLAIASGAPAAQALAGGRMVAEGVRTTRAACAMASRAGVVMPIAEQMRAVLHEGKSPRVAAEELMLRSLKRE